MGASKLLAIGASNSEMVGDSKEAAKSSKKVSLESISKRCSTKGILSFPFS